jgi:hypothetical protein
MNLSMNPEPLSLTEYLKFMDEASSKWEFAKQRSTWHFDFNKVEPPQSAYRVIGRIHGEWRSGLTEFMEVKAGNDDLTSIGHDSLGSERADLASWGHGQWGYDALTPSPYFMRMAEGLGLKPMSARINRQSVGQAAPLHIDCCTGLLKEKQKELHGLNLQFNSLTGLPVAHEILRVFVMLTDWEPGHFFIFGNQVYSQWKKGDIVLFDWVNMPHATANAGHNARFLLKVTGLLTPESVWMKNSSFQEFYL